MTKKYAPSTCTLLVRSIEQHALCGEDDENVNTYENRHHQIVLELAAHRTVWTHILDMVITR